MNTNARWNVLLLVTLLLALGGCGGGGSGACSGASLGSVGSLVCGSSSSNQAPVALVSGPVTVAVRTAATLDGSGSKDPDGQALTYRWEISAKPAGSAAALSDAVAAKPVITPDVVGTYTVRLIVNDGKADSSAAVFSFTATRINNPPLAKAGDDLTAVNGTEVVLNGTGSSDPDGDLISYRWVLATKPVGSAAQLSGADTPRPFFTPDVSGPYVVSLVTSDGALLSAPAFVTVTSGAANVPPTAVVTGPSSVVLVGTRVTLDASGSVDPNGDLLRYTWSWISRPTGSAAVLGFTTTARPEFVPDQAGDYVVRLVVSDGRASSPERSVTVRAARTAAPLVNAGSSQSVLVGSTIDLDGSGTPAGAGGLSNATLLSYQWTLVSRPEGSSTARTILNASAAKAQFIPDAAGTFVFRLTVTDSLGNASSDVVTVLVSQRNAPPVANAGGNRTALVGETVLLDGSRSTDANPGDVLTYAWQLISSPTSPQASTAKLSPASNPAGSTAAGKVVAITPDVPGSYVVGLVVRDGTDSSEVSLATITVRAANQAPRAVITGPSTGTVGKVMTFDGRNSTDDGPTQLLTYRWRLEIKPTSSTLQIAEPTLPILALIPDQPGQYVLRLQVDDGSLKSQDEPLVITIAPAPTGGSGSGS
ncbi:MAG: hypothetical protein EBQ88_06585 [Betaproteobacteria bacterium]|nr:hypothetical protein [Betaproteobacteria bacterium]